MKMLEVSDQPFPKISVRDHIGPKWLGRCTMLVKRSDPSHRTTEIEIQKSVMSDPATLERVVAHEVCHLAEYVTLPYEEVKEGGLEHGHRFLGFAAKVNQHMGADYVTVKSDKSFKQSETTSRSYYLLISHADYTAPAPTKIMWCWAAKLGPKGQTYVSRHPEAKLVKSTDSLWTQGAKIGDGWTVPKDEPRKEALEALFRGGHTSGS